MSLGYFAQTNFHLFDGEWHAVDTIVQLSSCTSFDVYGQAELMVSNARLGIPTEWHNWKGRGQITVSEDARLIADHCDLHKIQLLTNDRGSMTFNATIPAEEVVLQQRGGPIWFLPESITDPSDSR